MNEGILSYYPLEKATVEKKGDKNVLSDVMPEVLIIDKAVRERKGLV